MVSTHLLMAATALASAFMLAASSSIHLAPNDYELELFPDMEDIQSHVYMPEDHNRRLDIDGERETLEVFWEATNGPYWTSSQEGKAWNFSDPNHCSWFGIVCDENGRVKYLRVGRPDNNISGTIPDLSKLSDLYFLWLNGNPISGTLPDFGGFKSLTRIMVRDCDLSGTLPDNLGPAFITFLGANNRFEGTVPSFTAASPSSLMFLTINDNLLSGPLPNMTHFANTALFFLHNNALTGTIPPLDLPSLSFGATFGNNRLTGTLPPLDSMGGTTEFGVEGNQLRGTVPSLASLASIANLRLNDNEFTGALPDISTLSKLTSLDVSNNDFLGSGGQGSTTEDSFRNATTVRISSERSGLRLVNGVFQMKEYPPGYDSPGGRPTFQGPSSWLFFENYTDYDGSGCPGFICGERWAIADLPGSPAYEAVIDDTAEHPLLITATWKTGNNFREDNTVEVTYIRKCRPTSPAGFVLVMVIDLTQCSLVFFLSASDVCEPGSTFREDLSVAFPLQFAQKQDGDACKGCTGCSRCEPGKASAGFNFEGCDVELCPKTTFCPEGSAKGVECPAGSFGIVKGMVGKECSGLCPEGTFCPKKTELPQICPVDHKCPIEGLGEPIPCAKGKYSAKASLECEACEPGRFTFKDASDRTKCSKCDAGTFSNADQDGCVGCPVGTYNPFEGIGNAQGTDEVCLKCPSGRKGKAMGGSTVDEGCEKCPDGFVSDESRLECKPCPPGTWQQGDKDECQPCPAGRFGSSEGLASEMCDGMCGAGKYSASYSTACTDCQVGKFSANEGTELCEACNADLTSEAGAIECFCGANTYRDSSGTCILCTEGMDCSEAGNELSTLSVRSGFWRGEGATVIECGFKDACSDASTCAPGNQGVLCAVCEEGWYRPSQVQPCKECSGSKGLAIFTVIVSALGFLLLITLILWMNRRLPNGILRPIINGVQNITILLLFKAPYPEGLSELFKAIGVLDLGIEFVYPTCLVGSNISYYEALVALTLVVFFLLLALSAPILHIKLKEKISFKDVLTTTEGDRALKDVFVFVLLVHPGLSGKAMQFFRCREIDGTHYLMADYAQECYDKRWWSYSPLAVGLLIFVALGIPAAIFWVLFMNRKRLYDDKGRVIKSPLDVLYRPYRKEAYQFESASMLFKIFLWATLVYFESGTVFQMLATVLINGAMLCAIIWLQPMGHRDARIRNLLQITINALLAGLALGGLCMNYAKVEINLAERSDRPPNEILETKDKYNSYIEAIQIALSILTYALLVVVCVYVGRSALRQASKFTTRSFSSSFSSAFGSSRNKSCTKRRSENCNEVSTVENNFDGSLPNPMQRECEMAGTPGAKVDP